jgi:hypothetical protein
LDDYHDHIFVREIANLNKAAGLFGHLAWRLSQVNVGMVVKA